MVSFTRIAEITASNSPAALCIVTETKGSTPQKSGARMIVLSDGHEKGRVEGTIGGGAIEKRVEEEARLSITEGSPRQVTVSLTHELGMCCGGQMTIYIEPLREKPPCIILGAGHIGEALTRLAHQAGFCIVVADPRSDLTRIERLACASKIMNDYTSYDLDQMPFGPDCYVVIATHCHQTDQKLVEEVLKRSFRYAALVGSLRKAKLTQQRCQAKGFCEDKIRLIQCPAGIDIGAQTPEEIAFSITAEMIRTKRLAQS